MATPTPLRRSKRIAIRESKQSEHEYHTRRRSQRIAHAPYAEYHAAACAVTERDAQTFIERANIMRELLHMIESSVDIEMKKVYVYYLYKYLLASGACLWQRNEKFRAQICVTSRNLLQDLDNNVWSVNTDTLRPLLYEMINTVSMGKN
jgi:hypothetical protein